MGSGTGSSGSTLNNHFSSRLTDKRSQKQAEKADKALIKQFIKSISSGSQPSAKSVNLSLLPQNQHIAYKIPQIEVRPISGPDEDSSIVGNQRAAFVVSSRRQDSIDSLGIASAADSTKLFDLASSKNTAICQTLSEKRRGRKSRNIIDYCEHTENRIKELKEKLADPMTEESQKPKIRNQISAYNARMKAKK